MHYKLMIKEIYTVKLFNSDVGLEKILNKKQCNQTERNLARLKLWSFNGWGQCFLWRLKYKIF